MNRWEPEDKWDRVEDAVTLWLTIIMLIVVLVLGAMMVGVYIGGN